MYDADIIIIITSIVELIYEPRHAKRALSVAVT